MQTYYRFLLVPLCIGLCVSWACASWEMFSDGKDTYLYNTQSGDVYIRYNRGGKNYEDIFVKMPAGTLPSPSISSKKPSPNALSNPQAIPPTAPQTPSKNDSNNSSGSKNNETSKILEQQQQAMQKSQEILRNSIDTSGVLE